MTPLHLKTLAQHIQALAQHDYTSVRLTEYYLNRIEQLDGHINSFISITPEHALNAAQASDTRRQNGTTLGPLDGIPIAHKDIFCTQGVKTSCGSKMLDNFISPYNAHIVEQCQQAGLIMLGKTNMDEFAMGSSSESSYYGPVKNPWSTAHVAGGSSGGAAAALAAHFAPLATGTDTGGSIRQPAAFCGLTGLKPTYGRVSRFGVIAYASSLDQAGPMGHSAEDCAYLLNVMAGHDARDSTSIDRPVDDYVSALTTALPAPATGKPLEGLRIGLPKQYFQQGLDPDIKAHLDSALAVLERQGAVLVEVDLAMSNAAISAYYLIAPAEASANLSRYDGVRYGYRCANPTDLTDLYQRSRGEGFGPEVKRRILIGTYALSAGYYDAYYLKAQKVRRLIAEDFKAAFGHCDVIAGPTAPTAAFAMGAKQDPIAMYLGDIYTVAVNLAGLPALSMPCGFDTSYAGETDGPRLPVGLQLIGNYWQEAQLLALAHHFQGLTDWHTQFSPIAAQTLGA